MERNSWRSALLFPCIGVFFGAMCYSTLRITISLYAYGFSHSYAEVGSIGFIIGIVQTLATIPLGKASDKLGRRKLMLLGMTGITTATLAFSYASNIFQILWVSGFLGIMSGAWWPSAGALIADLAPTEKRGGAMAMYSISWAFAYTVGPMLGGFILDVSGFHSTFLFCFFAGVTSVLPTALKMEKLGKSTKSREMSVHSDNALMLASLAGFVYGIFMGVIYNIFPVFAKSMGLIASQIGLLIMILGITRIITLINVGALADGIGLERLMALGLFICSICISLLMFAENLYQFLAVMGLIGVGIAAIYPSGIALAAGSTSYGFRIGVYEAAVGGGFCLGPLIGGILADQINIYASYFFCMIVGLAVLSLTIAKRWVA